MGKPGDDDSKSASYGVTFKDGKTWHMYYLGTPNVTPAPDLIPMFPYQTMKAIGKSPSGPWTKQKDVVPFRCKPGTYYSVTASPGFISQELHVVEGLHRPAFGREMRQAAGRAL